MAGKLIIAGGGMDAHYERIFSAFLEAAGGRNAKIAMVVSASGQDPDDTYRGYKKDLVRLGAREENVLLVPLYGRHIRDERGYNALTGDEPSLPALFEGVTGVWFTGGDQYYIAQCFLREDGSDTRALEIIRQIYENGGALGGTSAGAAIMSRVMIGFGNDRGVIFKDTRFDYGTYSPADDEDDDPVEPLLVTRGLGFFPHGVVDQHFNKRPRLLRVLEAALINKEGHKTGFAVSEDTALILSGETIEVLGAAGVYVFDCRNAVKTGKACYENVAMHALHEGDVCDANLSDIRLKANERPQKRYYRFLDWVSGLTPDNPGFSMLLGMRLLFTRADCLLQANGALYCKGLSAYSAYEKTRLSELTYYAYEHTEAYEAEGGLSFKNVGLSIKTGPSELLFK